MTCWALGDIAACLDRPLKKLAPETVISEVSTDSRTLRQGSLFVPLIGEKFDGHEYLRGVVEERKAIAVLWSRGEAPQWLKETNVELFEVPDTLEAYQKLGLFWRKKCGVRCLAVTGSVGKTTTKEFLAHFLAPFFKLHKSQANFNNDIGVPKTLLEVTPEHEVVIVEMGMRGPGEIARLVRAAEPEVGIITAVGTSHIELLGSREAIARAKGELVAGLPVNGTAVLPAGDDFFDLLVSLSQAPVRSYSGRAGVGDISPQAVLSQNAESTRFVYQGNEYRLPLPGNHHLHDLFAVLATGAALGLAAEALLEHLSELSHPDGRAEWSDIAGARFYLDAYNSAPESLHASLGVLKNCPGRRIAVLGDMLELGPAGPGLHAEIGDALTGYGVELALCYGDLSRRIAERGSAAGVDCHWFSDKAELASFLSANLRPGDSVLVKASRGMALETVIDALKERVG